MIKVRANKSKCLLCVSSYSSVCVRDNIYTFTGAPCNVRMYTYVERNAADGLDNEKELFRQICKGIHH